MGLELITPPDDAEILKIVSLTQMKTNLRISHTKEDEFIEDAIKTAYAWLDGREGWLNRCILTQTWRLTLPGFQNPYVDQGKRLWRPADVLELPLPLSPLQSVDAISYAVNGATLPLAASAFRVDKTQLLGAVSRGAQPWPSGLDSRADAVQIDVTCGWGDGETVVKYARGLQRAIMLLAGDLFRNREDTYAEPRLVAVNRKIANGVTHFAGRYRIFNDHA